MEVPAPAPAPQPAIPIRKHGKIRSEKRAIAYMVKQGLDPGTAQRVAWKTGSKQSGWSKLDLDLAVNNAEYDQRVMRSGSKKKKIRGEKYEPWEDQVWRDLDDTGAATAQAIANWEQGMGPLEAYKRAKEQLQSRLSVAPSIPVLKLRSMEDMLSDLATVYARLSYRAVNAANEQVAEHIHRKLVQFVGSGGAQGDTDAFLDWLDNQAGDFSESYSKLVLRNAINTAHSAGRNEQFRDVQPILGLKWRYFTMADSSVRDEHLPYHNLVFDGDESNDMYKPPNDHN
ncbi:MAG: hypothetical protein GY835_22490 [bacterium]|nr:hypothetical protein [bacterium]